MRVRVRARARARARVRVRVRVRASGLHGEGASHGRVADGAAQRAREVAREDGRGEGVHEHGRRLERALAHARLERALLRAAAAPRGHLPRVKRTDVMGFRASPAPRDAFPLGC